MEVLRKELNKKPRDIFAVAPQERIVIGKEVGRGLADIGINERIGIELKKDLQTKKERNRLDGQLKDFLRAYKKIIIVLCGDTNPQELDEIKRSAEEFSRPVGFTMEQTRRVVVITKSYSQEKESKPKSLFDL